MAPITVDTYLRARKRIEVHAGVEAQDLSTGDLLSFLSNGYSFACKQQSFVAYRLWHRWGAGRGYWPLDPEVMEIRLRKPPVTTKPALTSIQAAELISSARSPLEHRVLYLGFYQGLRLAQTVAADGRAFRGSVLTMSTKGGWTLDLPVHPEVQRVLPLILEDSPTRRQIQNAVIRMRERVGLPITTHWFRRTFAQRLRALKVEESIRKALMGHSLSDVTDTHYSPPTWEELVRGLERLSYSARQLALFS